MRRTRWHLETDKGALDVLSHDKQRAIDLAEKSGYEVHSCESAAERKRQPQRWEFDHAAINAFCRAMGVSLHGLRFKACRCSAHRGMFRSNRDLGFPTIEVNATLPVDQANKTLIHELCHAKQFAEAGSHEAFHRRMHLENRSRVGYLNRPCEREAREWEALAETEQLVVPA